MEIDNQLVPVITDLNQLTPAWLSVILRRSGTLARGDILDIAVTPRPKEGFANSGLSSLRLTYSSDAPEDAPRHVILKRAANHDGQVEVGFYQAALKYQPGLPMLVPCYEAGYDSATGASQLLLRDYSETHDKPLSRGRVLALDGMPRDWQLDQVVDTIAEFHAAWWEHPILGHGAGVVRPWYSDTEHFQRHVARREREYAQFLGTAEESLSIEQRALYDRALAGLPRLWDRYLAPRVTSCKGLTMVNGDGYFDQFLVPLTPTGGRTFLVDFEEASGNFGAFDLVFLFATFWTREQRQEGLREERLLRRYHDTLQACGVVNYSWDELLADYRLMLALIVFFPIFDQTSGANPTYWRPTLRCLTEAFADHQCGALFDF